MTITGGRAARARDRYCRGARNGHGGGDVMIKAKRCVIIRTAARTTVSLSLQVTAG